MNSSRLLVSMVLALPLSVGVARADLTANLIGYWAFEEGSGTVAADSSGHGNNGQIVGTQWVDGTVGSFALEFNATTDDYVWIGKYAPKVETTVTVALWAYARSRPKWASLVKNWGSNDSGAFHFGLGNDTAGMLDVLVSQSDGTEVEVNHGVLFPLDDWHHCVFTADGSKLKLYLDGEEVAGGAYDGTLKTSFPFLAIGAKPNDSGAVTTSWGYWDGFLDDVRIYSAALTAGEVQQVMKFEPHPLAKAPDPQDGSMIDATSATLAWRAGDLAAAHAVYISDSFEDVDEGLVEPLVTTENSLEVGTAAPYPSGLTPGQTYYWRVDEVNDAHSDSPWKGNVWSFQVRPAVAWSPFPPDGSTYAPLDQDLTWENGINALFHAVYLGETFDEVNDAADGDHMIGSETFDPGVLEPGRTYYWRVDEYAGLTTVCRGDVWSFTTLPDIAPVDDPNLLLWWPLDEGLGSMTAADWSGHGYHNSLAKGPTWIAGGYDGNALQLDGQDDYLHASLRPAMPSQTVCAWVKVDQIPASILGWTNSLPKGGAHDRELYVGADGLVRWRVWCKDNTNNIVISSQAVKKGHWHHLAVLYTERGTTEMYLDGASQGYNNTSTMYTGYTSPHLTVGFEPIQARYLSGGVGDVRVYNKALSDDEIAEIMRDDPLRAGSPEPGPDTLVTIQNADALSWSAGDTAASHDVYLGTDYQAVADADPNAAEYRGNRSGTSFSLAGLVEFGGGDCYWRIDEVEADGTVRAGCVWKFTVPDYLLVDDFESYTNSLGGAVYETWIDGLGFDVPEPGNPGNGSGSVVGHDIWNGSYTNLMETSNVYAGFQAMPIYYDNTAGLGYAEVERTLSPAQDWTSEGVTTLVVPFRGAASNTGQLYVKINGTQVPYTGDTADVASKKWITWKIDLASIGVSVKKVTTLTIGIQGGETGVLHIDDIRLTKP